MLLFGLAMLLLGLLLIAGAYQKWNWLIDPDKRYWPVYSQALFKLLLGKQFLLYYTYALGVGFALGGIVLLISAILHGA
jgi:hypothetical protein